MTVATGRSAEIARQEKRFKATPEDHHKKYYDLQQRYGVSETVIRRWKRGVGVGPVRPNKTPEVDRYIVRHKMFGTEGRPAPLGAPGFIRLLAEEGVDVGIDKIYRMRHKCGVEPSQKFHPKGFEGPYRLTESDRRHYKLCSKVKSWGRPSGMEEYLNEVS